MPVALVIIALFHTIGDRGELHSLTVLNSVDDRSIVSLYIWMAGSTRKGDNLLVDPVPPGSSVGVSIPSGRCNLLAFDDLGNPYGLSGLVQKNRADSLLIDLHLITFGRPAADLGEHLFYVENSLSGLAVDTVLVEAGVTGENYTIAGFRLFPGQTLDLWLKKGDYSITAVDQLGRHYLIGSYSVPADPGTEVTENDLAFPAEPLGVAGSGNALILVFNSTPYSVFHTVALFCDDDPVLLCDDLSIRPGESILLETVPGPIILTLTDDSEAAYSVTLVPEAERLTRVFVSYGMLETDFSFRSVRDVLFR